MKLKTLKDIELRNDLKVSYRNRIKAEAIKWVKEDATDTPTKNKDAWALIFRWMKRLNITSEDLK